MKDQIKLAIVGCGGIAGAHLAGYERLAKAGYDRFRISAVVDPNPAGTAKFVEQIAGWQGEKPVAYGTVAEMLKAGKVDGADICTPHAMHHMAGIPCLKGGVNIMVEKPCGITIRASHKMLEAAAKSGAFIATAEQIRRCLPARTMEWAINKQKVIGTPRMMSMDVMFHQQFDWKAYAFAWRGLKVLGGGGMCLDAGAHFTDMMRFVFGEVDEVVCDLRTFYTPTLNGPAGVGKQPLDVEDSWMAILRFKSGFLCQWSWSREVRGFKVRTGVYYGSKGSLRDKQEWMHPFQFGADLMTNEGVETPYEELEKQYLASLSAKKRDQLFPYGFNDGMTNECWDFIDAMDRGRQPELSGEDGMKAKAICYAMYESNLSRGPVKVADVESGKVRAYQKPIDAYWKI
jgi:UDP-N-acetyl-2-amino-2-deoxyglucuronate dehydrogenase